VQVYWEKKAIQEHLDADHFLTLEGYAKLYVLPLSKVKPSVASPDHHAKEC
jgi:hypothetical protein